MSKNIVLLSDGTGQRGGVGYETNVWRLYRALKHDQSQVRCYDDGVGSQDFVLFKALGGAVGMGLSRNVRDLYTFLARHYEPGDRLYLFGFSRGAFTVRLLAGMIIRCGILDLKWVSCERDLQQLVRAAYCGYRQSYFSPGLVEQFRSEYGRTDIPDDPKPIRFLGVWDTVDAVGVPFDEVRDAMDKVLRYSFRDLLLHPAVETGCHAVSIDDTRRTFHPMMWDERLEKSDRIEQVWFAGVHSNVGGGYPKCQMALVTLKWMLDRAIAAGLKVDVQALADIKAEADVHGRLYDSRRGPAAYYRYLPRDMERIRGSYTDGPLKLHPSALVRIKYATDGYSPHNLTEKCQTSAQGSPLQANGRWRQAMAFAWDVVWLRRGLYFLLWLLTAGILVLPWTSEGDRARGLCTWVLNGPLNLIRGLTPDWAGRWVDGMAANPCTALGVLLLLTLLIVVRQWLKGRQFELSSVGWNTIYPQSRPHSGRDRLLQQAAKSGWLRLARRMRNSRSLQLAGIFISGAVVRFLVLVMGPFLLIGRSIHSRFCFRNTALANCPCRKGLDGGASQTLSFVTKDFRRNTGIELLSGERYAITLEWAGWYDAHIEATPEGLAPGPEADKAIRRTRRWTRLRVPGEPLFALMAQVGKAPPLRVGKGAELVPERTGELSFFVNDACLYTPGLRGVFYGNNRGIALITIRHIG